MKLSSLSRIALAALSASCSASFAHDGHGLGSSHWHASDSLGLLLVGAVAAFVYWRSRAGK